MHRLRTRVEFFSGMQVFVTEQVTAHTHMIRCVEC